MRDENVVVFEQEAGLESRRRLERADGSVDPAEIDLFREVDPGAKSAGQRFIVDCWKRDGDSWKLAIRYAGEVGASSGSKPQPTKRFEKRY